MDTITYDDFAKVALRVAKIISATKVEGSSKLLKLEVKIKDETRTIVAGIAQNYTVDELIGKKIIIVANLAPRILKGIESNGMLLAAENESGELGLLIPDRDEIEDGASIR
ncbi:methionine--tRNA ligase subunit beta [Candidatus Micrarchaeota archaeon]|nr:methionine--tRNA ligase subunit beta [Candidatus Micrarchaeota archaeon]